MTPRRKAWLLVAVLGVAAVGLVAAAWPSIETWAYEEHEIEGMRVLSKQWAWWPGENIVFPPMVCTMCREDYHRSCFHGGHIGMRGNTVSDSDMPQFIRSTEFVGLVQDGVREIARKMASESRSDGRTMGETLGTFKCPCTHPSHQDE